MKAVIAALAYADIARLTGGRPGTHDVACPRCGPERRTPANRVRRVLRVWQQGPGFATYCCARCGAKGAARQSGSARRQAPDLAVPDKQAVVAAIWARRLPLAGTPGERYLRDCRGCPPPYPATMGFLPARGAHAPAVVSAFALAEEPAPGVLAVPGARLAGLHLIRLRPDGSGKASLADGRPARIMLGRSLGAPIVLAPMSDRLDLFLCEGVETGLSLHLATGAGVWAAGAAARLPALADAVPAYAQSIVIAAEDDVAGRTNARHLRQRLSARGLAAELLSFKDTDL